MRADVRPKSNLIESQEKRKGNKVRIYKYILGSKNEDTDGWQRRRNGIFFTFMLIEISC